jgi:hypothetical protein
MEATVGMKQKSVVVRTPAFTPPVALRWTVTVARLAWTMAAFSSQAAKRNANSKSNVSSVRCCWVDGGGIREPQSGCIYPLGVEQQHSVCSGGEGLHSRPGSGNTQPQTLGSSAVEAPEVTALTWERGINKTSMRVSQGRRWTAVLRCRLPQLGTGAMCLCASCFGRAIRRSRRTEGCSRRRRAF